MKLDNTALRLLVKSYANGLLERQQYLKIRQQLLNKLSSEGEINQEDLQNFMKLHHESENRSAMTSYSASDWLIIALGLLAAATLALILFG